ncbi:MAG: heavy-metal-associated domain-containing protein [Chloroflexota bacterium]
MEKLILDLPAMYADHHTLQVRQALLALEGVEEVYASSAWKQVMISFDPRKVNSTAIETALTEAGYSPGSGETPALVEASKIKRDPQWEALGSRVTKTNEADIRMSGEFRRY